MAQVAINWVANRPGVASVLIGATKLHQLQDNLGALDFNIPTELQHRLDTVSQPETSFPYTFFEDAIQSMVHGGATVGDKPASFYAPVAIAGGGAGVTSDNADESVTSDV